MLSWMTSSATALTVARSTWDVAVAGGLPLILLQAVATLFRRLDYSLPGTRAGAARARHSPDRRSPAPERGQSLAGFRGALAGPCNTSPVGPKREPWHGQSQLFSESFQRTMQPRWVHTAERSWSFPCSSRYTATGRPPRRTRPPEW